MRVRPADRHPRYGVRTDPRPHRPRRCPRRRIAARRHRQLVDRPRSRRGRPPYGRARRTCSATSPASPPPRYGPWSPKSPAPPRPLGSQPLRRRPRLPGWFARELFGGLRQLRTDDDLWQLTDHHPVTQVDAIGNIPPRIRTWPDYEQSLARPCPLHSRRPRRRTTPRTPPAPAADAAPATDAAPDGPRRCR